MKTQFGIAESGDLVENTITIRVESEIELRAGRYAIVPMEEYKKMKYIQPEGSILNESLIKNAEDEVIKNGGIPDFVDFGSSSSNNNAPIVINNKEALSLVRNWFSQKLQLSLYDVDLDKIIEKIKK